MIQKFNEFINESVVRPTELSDQINTPFMEFADRIVNRANNIKESIEFSLEKLNKSIEYILEEFDDIIVGEPIVEVSYDLSDVEVLFPTNVPNNDEAWETDESPVSDLEYRLFKMFDRKRDKVKADIYYKPTEDGMAYISIEADIVDADTFGCDNELISAIREMGRE